MPFINTNLEGRLPNYISYIYIYIYIYICFIHSMYTVGVSRNTHAFLFLSEIATSQRFRRHDRAVPVCNFLMRNLKGRNRIHTSVSLKLLVYRISFAT